MQRPRVIWEGKGGGEGETERSVKICKARNYSNKIIIVTFTQCLTIHQAAFTERYLHELIHSSGKPEGRHHDYSQEETETQSV